MRTIRNAVLIVLSGWLAAAGQIAQLSVQGRITDIEGRPLQGDITVIETGPAVITKKNLDTPEIQALLACFFAVFA